MRRNISEEVGQWRHTLSPHRAVIVTDGINIVCVCMKVCYILFGYDKKIYQTKDLDSLMYQDKQSYISALTTTVTFLLVMSTSLHSWFRLASETGSNCGTSPSLYANSLTQPCHPGVWMIWHTQYKHRHIRTRLDIKAFSGSPHISAAIEIVVFSRTKATHYFWHAHCCSLYFGCLGHCMHTGISFLHSQRSLL